MGETFDFTQVTGNASAGIRQCKWARGRGSDRADTTFASWGKLGGGEGGIGPCFPFFPSWFLFVC